jgi:NAD(P)-dependent dehydrogenase (short-subunit alcohol dehydrogenase family)
MNAENTDFFEKVVFISGGGSGIGRATCQLFAARGAWVAVADRDIVAGEETVALIANNGGKAEFFEVDVGIESSMRQAVDAVVAHRGRLDIAFNNAGITHKAALEELREEDWDRVINTNLKGVWLAIKHQARHMLVQGSGVIINTASTYGLVGAPGVAAYVAAKHGVIGLTKAAALEYGRRGIRVNAVCPSATRTGMLELNPEMEQIWNERHPLGRIAQPQEIARAVLWLASEEAGFVTGAVLPVDGGYCAQ